MTEKTNHSAVAIIGSGFAGLGMAIRLKQEGIEDFVVFERADKVGGTWRDNTYPGATCDVESHLYSYSFAPNPRWTRMWSPQPEILAYLQGCAERFKVLPHFRFGVTVQGATWNEQAQHWSINTTVGTFTAGILVSATGPLSEPAIPALPGLERFSGTVFHSARWNHQHDLHGRSVAVIGTGASAAQFIPAIQPEVKQLYLYQRTPAWVVSYRNRELSPLEKKLMAKFPILQRLQRLRIFWFREATGLGFRFPRLMKWMEKQALGNLQRKITDPELRKKLTPNYSIGCKRILLSRSYYPALAQQNVEVITEKIKTIGEGFIETEDGARRTIDTLILGTGFQLTKMHGAQKILGRGGRVLADVWGGSPRAHLGTTVHGFPNLFLLFGPNTGLGHTSVVIMLESQFAHVLSAIRFMRKRKIAAVEPRPDRQTAFNVEIDRKLATTVWSSGCASWYLDRTGRNSTLWPRSTISFRWNVDRFRAKDYLLEEKR